MHPVTVVAGEVAKMEMVQRWHTSYGGLKSKRVGVVIRIRERLHKSESRQSSVAAVESSSTPEQSQYDTLLRIVQRFEKEITSHRDWAERRNVLGQLRIDLKLSDEDWRLAYAMFMARNPSEIPHRRSYEKQRRMAEITVEYSGTSRKEGRNWRYPGEPVSFSIQNRQKQLFNNWTWPQEHTTNVRHVIDVGPHDEQMLIEPQPPRGETWNTILDGQKTATQTQWIEQWQSIWPKYDSPIPATKDAWNRMLGLPRRALEVKRPC